MDPWGRWDIWPWAKKMAAQKAAIAIGHSLGRENRPQRSGSAGF